MPDLATCAITIWEIDGFVKTTSLSGTNEDWPRFWSTFLGLLPQHLADDVASREDECDHPVLTAVAISRPPGSEPMWCRDCNPVVSLHRQY